MAKKIELLAPAGSMANLKAAVSRKADAVYLGMRKFSARGFATNFNEKYLKDAVRICKSNNVKVYLAMNTLIKNNEIRDFFSQLSYAYSAGIDAVIIQEVSFLSVIRKNYPDLSIHISTQAGVMNSEHAKLISDADRITLARELTSSEIKKIRGNFNKELEIFCHGALCASISGMCLFSSLIGGRSGNRGICAQPCRKRYNTHYLLSTKELCLIEKIPEIINLGINSIKIEGRMRTPYYVAAVTDVYKKAIDGYYSGNFSVTKEMKEELYRAFSRNFTKGWFSGSENMFNLDDSCGKVQQNKLEHYEVQIKDITCGRGKVNVVLPEISAQKSEKKLLVRVYTKEDAIKASDSGADIVYFDLFDENFKELKSRIKCKLFAVTPRIMLDEDTPKILSLINENKPDGLLAGNVGIINTGLPTHLDYNLNVFNDIGLDYFTRKGMLPIISPELKINELKGFRNKNFAVLVHGNIRLMALRHSLNGGGVTDIKGEYFKINKLHNGSEIINGKELGLLGKSAQLVNAGIASFFIDTDIEVEKTVKFYRNVLDKIKVDDSNLKKKYVLGWSYRGVI